jgi:hypothetical protein
MTGGWCGASIFTNFGRIMRHTVVINGKEAAVLEESVLVGLPILTAKISPVAQCVATKECLLDIISMESGKGGRGHDQGAENDGDGTQGAARTVADRRIGGFAEDECQGIGRIGRPGGQSTNAPPADSWITMTDSDFAQERRVLNGRLRRCARANSGP